LESSTTIQWLGSNYAGGCRSFLTAISGLLYLSLSLLIGSTLSASYAPSFGIQLNGVVFVAQTSPFDILYAAAGLEAFNGGLVFRLIKRRLQPEVVSRPRPNAHIDPPGTAYANLIAGIASVASIRGYAVLAASGEPRRFAPSAVLTQTCLGKVRLGDGAAATQTLRVGATQAGFELVLTRRSGASWLQLGVGNVVVETGLAEEGDGLAE